MVNDLYSTIIAAGTYKAPNIKTAEAAKVIENTQRDVNIALVNEFSLIFTKLGLDTVTVLEAAATKWNFQAYRPGLVGGHCIGVDPYYLAHVAKLSGISPQLILAGRKTNEEMSRVVAKRVVKLALSKNINLIGAKALILGCAFKEDCPDTRNSKAIELFEELRSYSLDVIVHDPVVMLETDNGVQADRLVIDPASKKFDIVVLAVPHTKIIEQGLGWIKNMLKENSVFFDLKSAFDVGDSDGRL